jgi:hypothetical protein
MMEEGRVHFSLLKIAPEKMLVNGILVSHELELWFTDQPCLFM